MAKENQESIDKIKAEKLQALERTLGNIEKHFGKGTIMKLGDAPVENIPSISTGSIGLDAALGIGGLPKGRVVEIYGPESSGKTTLAIHAVAEAQKLGGIAAFIDAEHAFDRFYAQKLGLISRTCSCRNQITASRRLKLPKTLFVQELLTSSSLTRWLP